MIGKYGLLIFMGFTFASCAGDDRSEEEKATAESISSIRNRDREVIEKWLPSFEENKTYEADGNFPSQCGGTPYKFRMKKTQGALNLNLRIGIEFAADFTKEESDKVLGHLLDCKSPIKDFWAHYGVDFDLEIENAKNQDDSYDKIVKAVKGEGRENASTYYFPNPDKIAHCSVYNHEIGHLLGLPDEYYEPDTCKRAEFSENFASSPSSLMSWGSMTFVDVELFPRHFSQLFRSIFPRLLKMKINYSEMERDGIDVKSNYLFLQNGKLMKKDDEPKAVREATLCNLYNGAPGRLPSVTLETPVFGPSIWPLYEKDSEVKGKNLWMQSFISKKVYLYCTSQNVSQLRVLKNLLPSPYFEYELGPKIGPAIDDDELTLLERYLKNHSLPYEVE